MGHAYPLPTSVSADQTQLYYTEPPMADANGRLHRIVRSVAVAPIGDTPGRITFTTGGIHVDSGLDRICSVDMPPETVGLPFDKWHVFALNSLNYVVTVADADSQDEWERRAAAVASSLTTAQRQRTEDAVPEEPSADETGLSVTHKAQQWYRKQRHDDELQAARLAVRQYKNSIPNEQAPHAYRAAYTYRRREEGRTKTTSFWVLSHPLTWRGVLYRELVIDQVYAPESFATEMISVYALGNDNGDRGTLLFSDDTQKTAEALLLKKLGYVRTVTDMNSYAKDTPSRRRVADLSSTISRRAASKALMNRIAQRSAIIEREYANSTAAKDAMGPRDAERLAHIAAMRIALRPGVTEDAEVVDAASLCARMMGSYIQFVLADGERREMVCGTLDRITATAADMAILVSNVYGSGVRSNTRYEIDLSTPIAVFGAAVRLVQDAEDDIEDTDECDCDEC